MSTDPNDVVGDHFQPGDEQSILEGFRRIFDVPRSNEEWQWLFRDNPAGTHVWVGKAPDGVVASHYATIPRRVRFDGAGISKLGEAVDSFVLPEFRQGLKREGLFSRTFHEFIAEYGSRERDVAMYGLPVPIAYRIGKRLMGYEMMHRIPLNAKNLEPQGEPTSDLGDGVTVESGGKFEADAVALAEEVLRRYPIATIRDEAYLNWRFVDRPGDPYARHFFRNAKGELIGYAVLRHHWRNEAASAVVELIAPQDHPKVPDLVRWIEQECAARGSERAYAMYFPGAIEAAGLSHLGWELENSDFRLVSRSYDKDFVTFERMSTDWWATFSDFDVV